MAEVCPVLAAVAAAIPLAIPFAILLVSALSVVTLTACLLTSHPTTA